MMNPLPEEIRLFQTITTIFLCANTSVYILEKLKEHKADLIVALVKKGLFTEIGLILSLLKEKSATKLSDKEQYDALIKVMGLLATGDKSHATNMQFDFAFKKLHFDFLNTHFSQTTGLYLTKDLLKSLFSSKAEYKTEAIDKPEVTKKQKQKMKPPVSMPLRQLDPSPLAEAPTQNSSLSLQTELMPEPQERPPAPSVTEPLPEHQEKPPAPSVTEPMPEPREKPPAPSVTELKSESQEGPPTPSVGSATEAEVDRSTGPFVPTFFKPTTPTQATSSKASITASSQREESEIKKEPLSEELFSLKKIPLQQMRTTHRELVILVTHLANQDPKVEMELVDTAVTSLYLGRYPTKLDLKIIPEQNYLDYSNTIEKILRDVQGGPNPQYSQLSVDCQADKEHSKLEFVFHRSRTKVCLSIYSKQSQNKEQRAPYLTLNSLKVQMWPFSEAKEFEIRGSAKAKAALENQLITINTARRPDFVDLAQLIEGEINFPDFKKDSELTEFLKKNSLMNCVIPFYLNGDPRLSISLGYLFSLLFNNKALGTDLITMEKLGIITRLIPLKSEDIFYTASFLDSFNQHPIETQQLAVYLFFYGHFIADNILAIRQDPTKVASCVFINALEGWFKPESKLSYYLKGIHQLLFNNPFNFQNDELFSMFQSVINHQGIKSQYLAELPYLMNPPHPSQSSLQAPPAELAFWKPETSTGDTPQQVTSYDGPS